MVKPHCLSSLCVLLALSFLENVFSEKISTAFITEMLWQYKDNPNVVVSPFFLSEGLMQLYLGTEGKTATEIAKVLGMSGKTKEQIIQQLSKLKQNVTSPRGIKLRNGNQLFVAKDVQILPEYLKKSNETFSTTPTVVDFANSNKTVSIINKWMNRQSNSKSDSNLIVKTTNATKILLLNGVYLQGIWKYSFSQTKKGPFHNVDKSTYLRSVSINMLEAVANFRYSYIKKLDADCVELPFDKSDISMIILLPKGIDGMETIIKNIQDMHAHEVAPKKSPRRARLRMPKFKLEFEVELQNVLENMGISNLFRKANFHALTNWNGNLKVDKIIQKAVVEVKENVSSKPIKHNVKETSATTPTTIDVNRPFVFLIKDKSVVYLAGRVTKLE